MSEQNKTQDILAKMKKDQEDSATAPAPEAVKAEDSQEAIRNAVLSATAPKATDERKYQTYFHARPSSKMITHKGTPVIFQAHKCFTDNQEVIEYLDEQIAAGIGVVTKGELVTSEHLDPQYEMKQAVIKEYLAKEAAKKAALEAESQGASSTGMLSSSQLTTTGGSTSSDAAAE